MELVDGVGALRVDVTEAQMLAHCRSVPRFHQSVVFRPIRPQSGLLDEQFAKQCGERYG
jgi:hypothetical protein